MNNTLKIARTYYIYKGVMILLLGVFFGLQAIDELADYGKPFLIAYGLFVFLFFAFMAMSARPALKFMKVSSEEQKRLFKTYQLQGRQLITCFSLLVFFPLLFRYVLHTEPLVALQLGSLVTFIIVGTINLRSALQMGDGVSNAK